MNTPLIIVDVGNTSTSIALGRGHRMTHVCRTPSGRRPSRTLATWLPTCRGARPRGAVLCSVVPSVTETWNRTLQDATGTAPLVVHHGMKLGIRIQYPSPATIGPDRLANAAAAMALHGCPAIVADFGTALTFDVLSDDGAYVGGAIAPGLPLMTDYLAEKTALLPHIRVTGRYGTIGKSTAGAMRIGAKMGYRGMVKEIVAHLGKGLRSETPVLCATGGFAKWVLGGLDMPFLFDPDLTLRGLLHIAHLNLDR